jgi:hypothetical protein
VLGGNSGHEGDAARRPSAISAIHRYHFPRNRAKIFGGTGDSPVQHSKAAQELENAEDFARRAKLMEEHGCSELSCLYERASIATALKAQILSELEKTIAQAAVPGDV